MKQRLGKVLSISIFSAACFALPVAGWAQTGQSGQSGQSGSSGGGTVAPDGSSRRGDALNKQDTDRKKDSSDPTKARQDAPPTGGTAEPAPTK